MYVLTAGGHLYSQFQDEEILFRTTQSIFEDRDLAIEPGPFGFGTKPGSDGKQYAQYGIGQPLLALPLYAIGRLAAPLAEDATWARIYGIGAAPGSAAPPYEPLAREIAPRFFLSLFNAFATAALVAALYLLMFELTGDRRASLWAAVLFAFGSMAWTHSRPFFTETAAVLFIVLAWLFALKGTRARMDFWLTCAGAAAGFAALVRLDSILLYPGLAILLLGPILEARENRSPRLHPFVSFCIPAALCGAVILGLNALHFGGPFDTGYGDQPEGFHFSTPILAGLYGFIFSAGKGLFFFSPALVLGLFGWRAIRNSSAQLTFALALSVLAPLMLMAKWQNWAGGWCWGPRHIYMIHPFLAIPIAFWIKDEWNRPRRVACLILLAIGVGVNLLGTSQDFILFHQLRFRDLYSPMTSRVRYDGGDGAWWRDKVELSARDPRTGELAPVALGYAPAPIQHSLYLPQDTVWAGYPMMWRELRTIDNLWIRLLRD